MAGLSFDEVKDALVFFAPVPNEEEVLERLRLLMRAMCESRNEPITPRPKQTTDSTYVVTVELSDDQGWRVDYDCREFSSGYQESGTGPTLIEALQNLSEV